MMVEQEMGIPRHRIHANGMASGLRIESRKHFAYETIDSDGPHAAACKMVQRTRPTPTHAHNKNIG